MSRPRVLTLEDGTVSLQGFSTERASALADFIKTYGQPKEEVKVVTETAAPTPTHFDEYVPTSELTEYAIGVRHDKKTNTSQVVTVAYNINTKEGKVISLEKPVSRGEAIGKFKFAAIERKFI